MTEMEVTIKTGNITKESQGEEIKFYDNEAKERTFYIKDISRETAETLLESIGKKVNEAKNSSNE